MEKWFWELNSPFWKVCLASYYAFLKAFVCVSACAVCFVQSIYLYLSSQELCYLLSTTRLLHKCAILYQHKKQCPASHKPTVRACLTPYLELPNRHQAVHVTIRLSFWRHLNPHHRSYHSNSSQFFSPHCPCLLPISSSYTKAFKA